MKSTLPRMAFVLLAILVFAAILLTLGHREVQARPSASSYNPSGLHGLQELLNRNGIPNTIDRLIQPSLQANDLVIAAYNEDGPDIFGRKPLEEVEKSLLSFLSKGGTVLVLPFDSDFRQRSFEAVKATSTVVNRQTGERLQINTSPLTFGNLSSWNESVSASGATFLAFDNQDLNYSGWMKRTADSGEPFASMVIFRKGILARTADGLFASNRFIDRADNAQLSLRLIQGLLPKGGRVVFAEAALGKGIPPSLVNTLGPWATGAYMQLLLFFLVVVISLGVRFGLPQIERRRELGQREILDAVSDVYRRAKSTAVALDAAYVEADLRIRRGLKLPANMDESERNRQLPPDLLKVLDKVDQCRKPHISIDSKGRQRVTYLAEPGEALEMLRALEFRLDEFLPKTKNQIS